MCYSELNSKDILCSMDISEKGAKMGSLMVSAEILNGLKPAITPETVEKGSVSVLGFVRL